MKRRIVVEYGEVANIAKLMGCTYEMVSHSLAFRKTRTWHDASGKWHWRVAVWK